MYYKVSTQSDESSNESSDVYNLNDGSWQSVAIKQTSSGYTWEIPVDFSSSKYESSNTFSSFENGDKVYVYFATKDNSGNISLINENPSAKVEVIIDGVAPEFKAATRIDAGKTSVISLLARDSGTRIVKTDFLLNGTVLDSDSVVVEQSEGSGEDEGWTLYEYTVDSSEFAEGQNKITVRAVDLAGNIKESEALVLENNAPIFISSESGIPVAAYKKSFGASAATNKEYSYVNSSFTTRGKLAVNGINNNLTSFTYKDTYITLDASGENEAVEELKGETIIDVADDGSFELSFPEADAPESQGLSISDYEGKFVTRTFTAQNVYGSKSTWEIRFAFDTTKPVLDENSVIIGGASGQELLLNSKLWFSTGSLVAEGLYKENGSGLSKIIYTLTDALGNSVSDDGIIYPVGTKFSSMINGFSEGQTANTLTIKAVDNAGNESELKVFDSLFVDTTKPGTKKYAANSNASGTANGASDGAGNSSLNEEAYVWYKYKDDALWTKCENSPVLTNRLKTVYLCGAYTDAAATEYAASSGLEEFILSVNGSKIPATLTPNANAVDGNWSCAFEPELLKTLFPQSDSYSVTLLLKDRVGNSDNSTTFTFKVDSLAPEFSDEYTVTPTSERVSGEQSISYVNGTITIETSVSDNITLQPMVSYSLDEGATWQAYGKTTKIALKNIDTTLFTDNQKKKILIRAEDEVGFVSEKEIELNVNQSTDCPEVSISNAHTDITMLSQITENPRNIFGTLSNKNIIGTISDDDGIRNVTVLWQAGEVWSDDSASTNEKIYEVGGKSSYTLSHELPSTEGSYLIKILVTDSKQEASGFNSKSIGPFLVGVDAGAPKLTVGTADMIYLAKSHTFTLEGTVDDAAAEVKVFNEVECKTLFDGTTVSENGSWKHTFTVGPQGDTIYIKATDNFGQSSIAAFTYRVDVAAPEFTITSVNGKEVSLSSNSQLLTDYGNLNTYFTVKGTLKDEDEGSGLSGSMFYRVSSEFDSADSGNYDIADGSWLSVSIKQSAEGSTWEAPIPLTASKFVPQTENSPAHFESFEDGEEVYLYFATSDNAGNVSLINENPSAKIKVAIDGVKPEFKAAPDFIAGKDSSVSVLARDTETGIKAIELYLNGFRVEKTAIEETSSSDGSGEDEGWTKYTYTIEASELISGQNKLSIKAVDEAGNEMESSQITVVNSAPVFTVQESGIPADNYKSAYGSGAAKKDYYYVNSGFSVNGKVRLSGDYNELEKVYYKDTYITLDASGENEAVEELKGETIIDVADDGSFELSFPEADAPESQGLSISDYEGKFVTRTFTAQNVYGSKSTWEIRFAFDTTKPVLKTGTYVQDDLTLPYTKIGGVNVDSLIEASNEIWFNAGSMLVDGRYEEAGSGIARIEYEITDKSLGQKTQGTIYTVDKGEYETFASLITGFADGNNGNEITFRAYDNAGNASDKSTFRINVDKSPAELKILSYKLEGMKLSDAGESVYVNGNKNLAVYGSYSDSQSGIKALNFKLGNQNYVPESIKYSSAKNLENNSWENENAEWKDFSEFTDAAAIKAIRYWKAEFTPTEGIIGDSKDFTVSGANVASSNSSANTVLVLDNTLPEIQEPKITETLISDSNSALVTTYKKSDSKGEKYYFNNTKKKITISGLASDNIKLDSVSLKITKETADGEEINIGTDGAANSGTAGQWKFENISLKGVDAKAVVATVSVEDISGNVETKGFTLVFDTTPPAPQHELKKGKDLYFRIGRADNEKLSTDSNKNETGDDWVASLDTDVGSKYSINTYGNDNTIEIRGSFSEASDASGIKTIYYKIFDSEPSKDDIERFVDGTLAADGDFAPLSNPEKRRVPYTNEDGSRASKEITNNFRTALAGFKGKNNYLVLVAEDNAGNRQLDSIDEKSYYSINKDTDAPEIASNVNDILFTNGTAAINISGTASDSDSGINNITVYIDTTAGGKPVKFEKTADFVQQEGAETGSWTIEIPADTFKDVDEGNISVYAMAIDKAGTGNSKTISAASISIDKVAPAVEIISPLDADINTAGIQINGRISLSGTANDRNGLKEENSGEKTLKLYYTTSESDAESVKTALENSSSVVLNSTGSGWKEFCSAAHETGWTSQEFSTEKLDGSNVISDGSKIWVIAAATDKAGNTGYSEPQALVVDQNTDRPILHISNLDKPEADKTTYLVHSTKITSSISDDDGISSLKIINSKNKPDDDAWTNATEVPVSSGSFSFDLGKEDGEKNLWFRIVDSKGGVFVTGEASSVKQPKLYFAYMEENASFVDGNAVLTFVMDNTVPVLGELKYYYGSDESFETAAQTVDTTTVVGGTEKRYIKFEINVEDNGSSVKNVEASIKVGTNIKTYEFSKGEDTNIWQTAAIDVGHADGSENTNGFVDASYTLTLTAEDKAGLSIQTTKNFTVDNSGPTPSLISPAVNDEVTGVVTLVGTTLDNSSGVSVTKFVIGKDEKGTGDEEAHLLTQAEALSIAKEDSYTCKLKTGSSESAWKFDLDGNTENGNPKLPASKEALNNYSTITHDEKDIYTLPVYLYAKDELGNESITKTYITYNPFGDRPKASVTYPLGEWTDTSNTEGYSNLSGSVRITGSAEDNESISGGKVYIQLDVNNDGKFNSSDLAILKELKDGDDAIYTIVENANTIPGQKDVSSLEDDADNFWGILAKGTNSWNFTVNTNNELQMSCSRIGNEDSGKYKLGVRAIAMDNTGVLGKWSDSSYFMIDLNAPSIESASVWTNPEATDEVAAAYESDMYLSGTKYLQLKISDKAGLKSVKYTYSTSLETINISDKTAIAELGTPDTIGEKKVYTINIPLSSLADEAHLNSDTVALKVVATKDSDTETTSYERYLVHFDNTAPSIDKLTLNSVAYEDSDKKIVNSNGYFTIGGQASDEGAGFERMSFYFMREPGTTINDTRLYDVLIAPSDSESDSTKQPNYISTSGLATKTVTVGSGESAQEFTIYGKIQSLTVADSGSSLTGFTTDSHVHAGGYLQIGETWHKISTISGSSVNLATPTTATGSQSVFFAYMESIDNTGTEKSDGAGSVVRDGGDDGDTMPESIIKSQTTWNYDASFFSNYIPDGPGYLVTFVYDKAGNVTAAKYAVSVQNKAPRLTKLWLSTDLNSDGKFADDSDSALTEIIEYNVLGTVGEQTNYKEMKTADYRGERFIIKNKLAVIPEFTNGNGNIYMALNNVAEENLNPKVYENASKAEAALYSSVGVSKVPDIASFTLARSGDTKWAYVIENNDLGNGSYNGETKVFDNRAMSFTFWDSTEDTISGVTSNYCFLRISDLVVNVDDVVPPNTVVSPFFWNAADDNSLYLDDYQNGHIELEESTGGYPAVSGKISIRGWAFDDHTLGSIWVKYDDFTPAAGVYDGTADDGGYYKVAAYVEKEDGTGMEWKTYASPEPMTGSSWAFSVTPEYLGQKGHKVNWQLDIDTSAITGGMGNNKNVYVRAIDATGAATDASSETVTAHTSSEEASAESKGIDDDVYNKPNYQMDVVPYISGIDSDANGTAATRSRLGRYPVRAGETIYIKGFNFGKEDDKITVSRHATVAETGLAKETAVTGETWNSTDANPKVSRINVNTISFVAPEYSGFINLSITPTDGTATKAVNNTNSNSLGYNIEQGYNKKDTATHGLTAANTAGTNFWTDDRYLSVWNSGESFVNASNPIKGSVIGLTNSSKVYTSAREGKTFNAHTLYGIWGSNDNMMYNEVMGPAGTNYNDRWYILSQQASGALRSPPSETDSVIVNDNVFHTWLDDGWADANTFGDGLQLVRDGETASTSESYIEKTSADKVRHQFQNVKIAGAYSESKYHIYVTYYDSYTKCLKYGKYIFKNNWDQNRSIETRYRADNVGSYVIDGYDAANNSSITWDVGEYSAIKIDNSGTEPIPVVAYYDKQNKQLKIARGSSSAPVSKRYGGTIGADADTTPWTYTSVPSPSGCSDFGRYVSMEMDKSRNLHIVAQDVTNGVLYYGLFTLNESFRYELSGDKWTAVDSTSSVGRWNDIKLENYDGYSMETCKPVITYQDASRLNTTAAVKIAFVDSNGCWEAMTSPSVFEAQDSKLSTIVTAIDKKNISNRYAIGINSTEFAIDFLRDELNLQ